MFEHAEIGYFLNTFEDDDLRIELKVGKAGQEFSPIDQLSAGQRCTAVFPMLLQLEEGPLIIDQPEDNLDNRHIATTIAPALVRDKRIRQMLFTSHNANLVVLTDAELIMSMESDGATGRLDAAGFLATRDSVITQPVLDIVDGGEIALDLRFRKYGHYQRRAPS
jgi:ABC-type cobalamin/Fe3+-siderophores transport system ATPase subunit